MATDDDIRFEDLEHAANLCSPPCFTCGRRDAQWRLVCNRRTDWKIRELCASCADTDPRNLVEES